MISTGSLVARGRMSISLLTCPSYTSMTKKAVARFCRVIVLPPCANFLSSLLLSAGVVKAIYLEEVSQGLHEVMGDTQVRRAREFTACGNAIVVMWWETYGSLKNLRLVRTTRVRRGAG